MKGWLPVVAIIGVAWGVHACMQAEAARPRFDRAGIASESPDSGDAGPDFSLSAYPDAAIHLVTVGDSTSIGSAGGVALSITSVYANVLRGKEAPSYPLARALEGLDAGGSNANVEMPVTAMADQIRQDDGNANRDWVVSVAGCAGCDYTEIRASVDAGVFMEEFGASRIVDDVDDVLSGNKEHLVGAAVVWLGYNDEEASMCAAHQADLQELQDDIQTYSQALTGQTYDVPLFIGAQISAEHLGVINSADQPCGLAQSEASIDDSHIYLAAAGYHAGNTATSIYTSDGVHPTNLGYQLRAEMVGRAVDALVNNGFQWQPLIPNSVTAGTSNIVVDYTVPCNSLGDCGATQLAFDTTNVICPHTGDQAGTGANCLMGFELDCGTSNPSPPIIVPPLTISGNQVTIPTNKNVPPNCVLDYALDFDNTSITGNGNVANSYGSPRGNLRDTTTTTGRRSTQALYTWGSVWERDVTTAHAAVATVATAIDDLDPTWGWIADSNTCPAAASAWTAEFGGVNLSYGAGTYACDTTTDDEAASAGIGSARVNESLENTSGYWRSTGAGTTTWDLTNSEDLLIVSIGKFERPAATDTLIWWRGDTATENEWYVNFLTNGNLQFVVETDGGDSTHQQVTVVPVTAELSVFVGYIDKKSSKEPWGNVTTCFNGTCASTAMVAQAGATGTGNLFLYANYLAGGIFDQNITGTWIMKGEKARAAVAAFGGINALGDTLYDRVCPPANQPCQ